MFPFLLPRAPYNCLILSIMDHCDLRGKLLKKKRSKGGIKARQPKAMMALRCFGCAKSL